MSLHSCVTASRGQEPWDVCSCKVCKKNKKKRVVQMVRMVLKHGQLCLPTFHKKLIITLIIILPNLNTNYLGNSWCFRGLVPSFAREHGSERASTFSKKIPQVTIIVGVLKGWSHRAYHACKNPEYVNNVPAAGESMISERLWGFTHTR